MKPKVRQVKIKLGGLPGRPATAVRYVATDENGMSRRFRTRRAAEDFARKGAKR